MIATKNLFFLFYCRAPPADCGSLENLDADRDYLKKGDVFTDDQIDAYMVLKWEEVLRFETTPHPVEFDMYYSV